MGEWFNKNFDPQMNLTEEYVAEIIKELNEFTEGKVKGEFKLINSNKLNLLEVLDKTVRNVQSSLVNFNNKEKCDFEVDKNIINKKDMNDYLSDIDH